MNRGRGRKKQHKACMECIDRCMRIHGGSSSTAASRNGSHPPPAPLSFFKVMVGNFTETLLVPPKFSHTLHYLIDEEVVIEDTNGLRWKIVASLVNGSLTFVDGWQKFVIDHEIKFGNFVVFNVTGNIISAQIFDLSAWEKLQFCEDHQLHSPKRKRGRHLSTSLQKQDGTIVIGGLLTPIAKACNLNLKQLETAMGENRHEHYGSHEDNYLQERQVLPGDQGFFNQQQTTCPQSHISLGGKNWLRDEPQVDPTSPAIAKAASTLEKFAQGTARRKLHTRAKKTTPTTKKKKKKKKNPATAPTVRQLLKQKSLLKKILRQNLKLRKEIKLIKFIWRSTRIFYNW